MSDIIKIQIKDTELKKKLKQLAEKTSNLKPVMRKISAKMHSAVEENFKSEGTRLGEKWQDLANSTKKQRAKIGKWPGQMLNRSGSGGLIGSISAKYTDNEATVGTNKVYAAIHQFGGTIKHSARERKLFFKQHTRGKHKGKTLFAKEKIASYGMKSTSGIYSVNIPARPFLGLNDDDLNKILGIVQEELEDV